jgi:predicted dehydrogenase
VINKYPIETALIVGLGSIGRKHLELLQGISSDIKIVVLRHKNSEVEKSLKIDHVVTNIQDALNYKPDIGIISNPSAFHIDAAMPLAKKGVHLLVEKPISFSLRDVAKLISVTRKNNCKLMVGYNLRFLESLKLFREEILRRSIGTILSVRAEVGQHLASWRSNIKYADSVSAQRKLGGGVLLELSHEFDYLSWIFGSVHWVFGYLTKQSDLNIDVEDIAHCFLGFKDTNHELVANITMDFFRQDPIRQCIVVGKHGSLRWDGINNSVELYSKNQKNWKVLYKDQVDKNFSYKQELNHFLECIANDSSPLISGESAMDTLRVIESIKKSSSKRTVLQVDYK